MANASAWLLTAAFLLATFPLTAASPDVCAGCDVVALDLASLRAEARGGEVSLAPVGVPVVADVRPAPWSSDRGLDLLGDGGEVVATAAVDVETFVGRVRGEPRSLVLLGVSTEGLDGFVRRADGTWTDLRPLRFTDPSADPGQVVVSTFSTPPPGEPASTSASAVYPDLLKWADSQFYARAGSADATWAKMKAVFDRMNVLMNNDVGFFYFDGGSVACTTTSCDSSWGMGSSDSDVLLREFAWSVYGDRANRPYDAAFLYTYKNLGVSGTSSEPGRYALVRMRDVGWQHSWSSDYEAALVMMHELGHTWGGDHRFYTTWDETRRTCSLVEIGSVCIFEGQEHVATHYTIMCTSCKHEPAEGSVWEPEFSDTNRGRVTTCNAGTWSSGEYEPWTEFENPYMAMGTSCKNPDQ